MRRSGMSRRKLLETTAFGAAAVVPPPTSGIPTPPESSRSACGIIGSPAPTTPSPSSAMNGGEEQGRGEDRLHHLAGRQGHFDRERRGTSGRRPRHHVHRAWQIQVHRRVLEPLDEVVQNLIAKAGPISPVAEYLAKADGKWFGIPTTIGSQVKPCCSRLDLYKQHCGHRSHEDISRQSQPRPQAGR